MDLESALFWTIGLMTAGSAVAVVIVQNIVRAAVWLLFTLAGTAALFFLMGADFVGATQLLIYVGGILVLVVFGVMLTAQGPFITLRTSAGEWAVALVVGVLLYGLIGGTVLLTHWRFPRPAPPEAASRHEVANATSSMELGLSLLGIDEATPEAPLTVQPAWPRTQMSYLLPFEIVSVHLLVVLIGAAYLARAKRKRGEQVP